MDPKLWRQGRDPQLEAGIAIALRELKMTGGVGRGGSVRCASRTISTLSLLDG